MKLSALTSTLALAIAATVSAPASAISFTAGDFKFNFDNYDAGTVGYPVGNPVCNTAATCDTAAGILAPNNIGSEDTWGIYSIQSITRISDNAAIYTKGDGGKYLTGVFYGLTDELVYTGSIGPTLLTSAYANGGSLKLWENTVDYDATNTPGGRIGADGFTGISDLGGTLLLEAVFAGSADALVPGYSYATTYNAATYAGAGQGFLDVVGGAWSAMLNTNSLTDAAGGTRDLFLDVTFNDVNGEASKNGWTVTSAGQVKGEAIPEPASLALIGLGLLGLTAIRRRRA